MVTRKAQEQLQFTLLSRISNLLETAEDDLLVKVITDAHPVDMASVLSSMPVNIRLKLWEVVPVELSGAILQELDDEIRFPLLESMDTQQVVESTKALDTDDLADVLQDIPDRTEEVLQALDEDRRSRLQAVLYFPEDVAGGVMDVEVVTVRPDVTISVVKRYLRQLGSLPDGTDKLFVTDRMGHFVGHVRLAKLLVNDEDVLINEVLSTDFMGFTADTAVEEVAERFVNLDLLSVAVVNKRNVLIGRITVDDIVDYIQEAGQRQLLRFTGAEVGDAFAPVMQSARRRAIWLGVNLLTAFLAAWVIGKFEPTIEQITALAVLMPVVASMGGIAGSQTLTLIIRSLSLGQLQGRSLTWVFRKEVLIGLLNGVFWAVVIGIVAWFWFGNYALSAIIAIAVIINLLAAAASAVLIPLLLDRMNIDPALAGGVVLTTITDVVGFAAFLGLATWLIL